MKNISINHVLGLLLLIVSFVVSACSYDEHLDTYDVEVRLSESIESAKVELTNNIGKSFDAVTDANGVAHFQLPAGIYSVSASKVTDDDYFRRVCNGSLSDIAIGKANTGIALPVKVTVMQTSNPILINPNRSLEKASCHFLMTAIKKTALYMLDS